MTNHFPQAVKASAMAAAMLAVLALTGCEDVPECLDWDTEIRTTTTYVNGKPKLTTAPVTYCAERAEEDAKRASPEAASSREDAVASA